MRVMLLQTMVMAMLYASAEAQAVAATLRVGATCELVPEPSNEYDSLAVAVKYGKHRLGYLPQGQTAVIHRLLAAGLELTGTIIHTCVPGQLRVEIALEVEKDNGSITSSEQV